MPRGHRSLTCLPTPLARADRYGDGLAKSKIMETYRESIAAHSGVNYDEYNVTFSQFVRWLNVQPVRIRLTALDPPNPRGQTALLVASLVVLPHPSRPLSRSQPGAMSPHWMSTAVRCDPAHVPYSLTAHHETLESDVQVRLLSHLPQKQRLWWELVCFPRPWLPQGTQPRLPRPPPLAAPAAAP